MSMPRGAGSRSAGKKVCLALTAALAAGFLVPVVCLATSAKTLTGVVKSVSGSQVIFSTTSAAKYSADVSQAQLTRKNGVAMQLSEILVGDKVEVKGTVYKDNSVSATSLRNLSLYTHTGTFTGKISTINTTDSSFVMDSKTYGSQTIHTNNFTTYKKNGSSATFHDLILGMTTTVKGMWDRDNTNVTATSVSGAYRLIDIYFTGTISQTNGSSLTVVGNGNVIYGVDLTGATLLSKNSKPMVAVEFNAGHNVKVWGKHISGSVAVVGTKVVDSTITK